MAYDNKFMTDYEVVKDQLPEEWHRVPTKPLHPKKKYQCRQHRRGQPLQRQEGQAKLPPEWSAMEDRTGRWNKTSPRTSGPDIKPANVRIGKSYTAQKERKKAVKKRQKGPTGKE